MSAAEGWGKRPHVGKDINVRESASKLLFVFMQLKKTKTTAKDRAARSKLFFF